MSTTISEPPARRLTRKHRSRPAGIHFSRLTRIARWFGAGFQPTSHPELAEGTLLNRNQRCKAVLSYDPVFTTVRLVVRVAHTRRRDRQLESILSNLEAGAEYGRFDPDLDAGKQVTLSASTKSLKDGDVADRVVAAMFQEVIQLVWDPRLHEALNAAGASLCIDRADPWTDISINKARK